MTELPYFDTSLILKVDDYKDSEGVCFKMMNDGIFEISRETTYWCDKNPEKFPEIPGFELYFTLDEALKLRDFLNHALPLALKMEKA